MNKLEDRLNHAADRTQTAISHQEVRSSSHVRVRHQRRRTGLGVVAVIGVTLTFVVTGALINSEAGSDAASDVAASDVQVADGLAPLSDLPMIGTSLPGWEIGATSEEDSADGGGLRTALYYTVVNDDTVFAKLWIRGITEGSVYETDDRLLLDEAGVEELTVRGHDARMKVDGDDYDIVWRDSPTVLIHLAVNTAATTGSGRAIALAFADSLVDLTPEIWADYRRATEGVGLADNTPTTTFGN